MIAVIVGRDAPTIDRWRADGGPMDARDRRRIVDTLRIVDVLLRVESPAMMRARFIEMNPDLEDANPAELLPENRTREVLLLHESTRKEAKTSYEVQILRLMAAA